MMARLHTGCQDVISLRNGYHGNAAGTMGSTAQSSYKFNVVQACLPMQPLDYLFLVYFNVKLMKACFAGFLKYNLKFCVLCFLYALLYH